MTSHHARLTSSTGKPLFAIVNREVTNVNPRQYERIYDKLTFAEYKEMKQLTNCFKPCKYKQYAFIGERAESTFKSEHFTFSLWAVSRETTIKTEQLIYPLSALVAEFGGTLGLFLGFSFITLWDKILLTKAFSHFVKLDSLKTTWCNLIHCFGFKKASG